MRRLGAALGAGLVALVLVGSTGWHPLCVAYTPNDPMWYILMCWVDPPPPHSEG